MVDFWCIFAVLSAFAMVVLLVKLIDMRDARTMTRRHHRVRINKLADFRGR
jgi:cytochrome c-type biogenesis protein CcmH/NrfG